MHTINEIPFDLDKLHTTSLGVGRIKKNISMDTDDIVGWCKSRIQDPNSSITRKRKNWYIDIDNCIITVNAHSHTIITAHMIKNKTP